MLWLVTELAVLHLPGHDRAVVVAPQDVGIAVGVEVAGALDLPAGRRERDVVVLDVVAVLHLPGHDRAVAVAPDDVAVAVGVEVARCPAISQPVEANAMLWF